MITKTLSYNQFASSDCSLAKSEGEDCPQTDELILEGFLGRLDENLTHKLIAHRPTLIVDKLTLCQKGGTQPLAQQMKWIAHLQRAWQVNHLSIEQCQIREFDLEAISFDFVRTLSLCDNHLARIPKEFMRVHRHLVSLDLSGNSFSNPEATFFDLIEGLEGTQLEQLGFRRNKLKASLPTCDLFIHYSFNLKRLDISHNQLGAACDATLVSFMTTMVTQSQLEVLNLTFNQIKPTVVDQLAQALEGKVPTTRIKLRDFPLKTAELALHYQLPFMRNWLQRKYCQHGADMALLLEQHQIMFEQLPRLVCQQISLNPIKRMSFMIGFQRYQQLTHGQKSEQDQGPEQDQSESRVVSQSNRQGGRLKRLIKAMGKMHL